MQGRRTRRDFIRGAAGVGATLAASRLDVLTIAAQSVGGWSERIGLELYTVRDQMANDFEGVLAKIAAIGYKEIEPANG